VKRDSRISNRILLSLPDSAFSQLQPNLEYLETANGKVLDHANAPVKFVYFVNRGIVSLVKTMRDGRTVEIGVIGIEGITDPHVLFGIDKAILETVIQIPGSAVRIRTEALAKVMEKEPALRRIINGYRRFLITQFAQTAACNRLHSLEQRCCKWLLIAHDSALSDTFPLTHEFLSMMLGVQRPGVTLAASELKKSGIITYSRGRVTIVNRPALEALSCECYETMRGERTRMFGSHAA
jgi:CRP-like cAMP-binding protein